MDGASKFARGNAIAGLLVVLINVIGGMVIGIVQQASPSPRPPTPTHF
jgi:flagellar biosynthesis protein FlhA